MRTDEEQQIIDKATEGLALYHYATCWFCARVRKLIDELKLNIELRDIFVDPQNHQTLIANGGSGTVPCLRIEEANGEVIWMYESADICEYLQNRFAG